MNTQGILFHSYDLRFYLITRKSSCVNARGIPSAALHLGRGGRSIPSLARGAPHPWLKGTPSLVGGTPSGYPPILTHPSLGRGTLCWGTLHPDLARVTPSWGTPCANLAGVPQERTWDQWEYYGMEMGYPPCERTDTCVNITSPHSVGIAGGNNSRDDTPKATVLLKLFTI